MAQGGVPQKAISSLSSRAVTMPVFNTALNSFRHDRCQKLYVMAYVIMAFSLPKPILTGQRDAPTGSLIGFWQWLWHVLCHMPYAITYGLWASKRSKPILTGQRDAPTGSLIGFWQWLWHVLCHMPYAITYGLWASKRSKPFKVTCRAANPFSSTPSRRLLTFGILSRLLVLFCPVLQDYSLRSITTSALNVRFVYV
jgi:hypothetical protein